MLSVSTDDHDPVMVIHVAGDVDATTAGLLRDALTSAMADGRLALVADLSAVDFMDSTGLGVLVGRLKAVRQLGGVLHCVVTTDRIRHIFLATGLERVLPLHESVDEAVAAVTELPS
ncbi:STAS domain-containing protein [Nostocoides veronense]|uniref:Anti-sigma factor antagonist n=1 Tax=Nostocoides veronense TaxID=330836 RepID=A0ABN2LA43_9MICO